MSGSQAFFVSMSQIMARVRVCSGLSRYRSLRILLTSTGGSSNRVLDGALQASLYSRAAESNAMADATFIEFSAHTGRGALSHPGPYHVVPCSVSTTRSCDIG